MYFYKRQPSGMYRTNVECLEYIIHKYSAACTTQGSLNLVYFLNFQFELFLEVTPALKISY